MSNFLLKGIEKELLEEQFSLERLEELNKCLALIPNLTNQRLDKWNGLQVANKILVGQGIAIELYSIALRVKNMLYARRKREGSIAFLERSSKYFETMGIKATEGSKTEYKEKDEFHHEQRIKEGEAEALVEFLKNQIARLEKSYYLCRSAHDNDQK